SYDIMLIFNVIFTSLPSVLTIIVAEIISGLFAIIHAFATISFRADNVISGIAINFLALCLGVFLTKQWYDKGQTEAISKPFYTMNIPVLSDIPVIGSIFFQGVYITSYLAIILAFVAWYVLFKTSFGLRLRAVG